MFEALDEFSVADLATSIDGWLYSWRQSDERIVAVDVGGPDDCGPGERRWYLRLRGEAKEFTTIWLTLGQRTLRYETYVLPWPPQHPEQIFESVLRRNDALVGCHYSVGVEDALFLRGEMAAVGVNEAELDRVVGTLFAEVERSFRGLATVAFAPPPASDR
jgi:Putative bacterial sensory transduction regulator